ncbi:MAG: hypothetical protein GQ550_00875 [Gammaproteobacteria bacterium]|nr:hypothetical protein [Gammaproteobacteria bacterium]
MCSSFRLSENSSIIPKLKFISLLCLLVVLQSCASYGRQAATMRDGLLHGDPAASLAIAEEKDLDQEEVIASLDKGMLRRINNDFKGSNQIFEVAKSEIEKLYGFSVTENLASVSINETFRGYEGDAYEQLLLHAYMAMNYIQLGQMDSARVEMLQANVKMKEWGDEPEEDAFLRYLEGIIYENLDESDSALISYRKAYTVYKEKGGNQYPAAPLLIKKDLLRLLAREGLWSEYKSYKKEFGLKNYKPLKENKRTGELVVILNNGLAPIRSETTIPIYSAEVENNLRVSFPVYKQKKGQLYRPRIEVNKKLYAMETVEDVDALARHSLQEAMPGIMARAMARAVVKYTTQKTASDSDSLAGLFMTITNLVTERADTRSWSTLPQAIQLQRIRLPIGTHHVQLQLLNSAGGVADVIDENVTIRPKQSSFIIKHWNIPVPKTVIKPVVAAKEASQQNVLQAINEKAVTEKNGSEKTLEN